MALKKFERGFDGKKLAITNNFLKAPIGEKLISSNNNTFQICFRDKYINIYWKGCSILKYSPTAKKSIYSIHYKYTTLPPNISPKEKEPKNYINLMLNKEENDLSPEQAPDDNSDWSFLRLLNDPSKFVKKYSKGEKRAIALYLQKTFEEKKFLLLDLEIAFSRINQEKKKPVADRIDMACIFIEDDKPVLKLIEVKQAYDSRLKSDYTEINSPPYPEVMNQMEYYSKFIEREGDRGIKESYQKVAENYYELIYKQKSIPESYFPDLKGMSTKQLLEKFIADPRIDKRPYLYILEVKNKSDRKAGKYLERGRRNHQNHWERLKELFNKEKYPKPIYEIIKV